MIPAAQYLRMSTEQQQYSLENQAAAIQDYADRQGFEIIKTYSDAAKSGVLFRRRPGLSRLLQDVINGNMPFQAVLVYDVSRWGRFQDADEAAHYEFLCRQAHIPVHYCGETFANDASLPSSVMKALKRAMAAEYSRELGVKVFAAEKRWAEQGFKQGGLAGYGLRRLMISSDGVRKQLLSKGEVKCLQSDRVILVPGPPEEVDLVREIYRLAVEEERTPFDIARHLNRRGLTRWGRRWSHQYVHKILTHPKYAGHIVWNQTSRRLGGPSISVRVHELYFEPQYPEFQARTIFSLTNAFTSAFKQLDPMPQVGRQQSWALSSVHLIHTPALRSAGPLLVQVSFNLRTAAFPSEKSRPRPLHGLFERILPRLHPRSIVLLRCRNRTVREQD